MAEAEAQANAKKGKGEEERMAALLKHAGSAGGDMMLALEQLETVRETIGRKDDKIILMDSQNPIAGLFGAVAAGRRFLATSTKTTSASPPPPKPGTRKS